MDACHHKYVVPTAVKSGGRTQNSDCCGLRGLWEDGDCLVGGVLQFGKV